MSESIRERMTRILNETGVYRLTGSSSADWELGAFAAGLEDIERAVSGLLDDLFPATASPERLESWEKLFQPLPGAGSLEDRRETARERLAMAPARFTPGDFAGVLRAAGVIGQCVETQDGLTVAVGRLPGLSPEECARELDLFLPAHLGWTWLDDVNWTAFDAWSAPFSQLDERGLTWEELEAMTREQLEAGNEEEEED